MKKKKRKVVGYCVGFNELRAQGPANELDSMRGQWRSEAWIWQTKRGANEWIRERVAYARLIGDHVQVHEYRTIPIVRRK